MSARCSAMKATRLAAAKASRPARRSPARRASLGEHRRDLADEGADRGPELGRPTERVALPERQPSGLAGRGGDQHPVVGDVLDPPARRAEREDVADPRLVDHLLVELADPATAFSADEEDPEQAAVGDRAAGGDGEPLGARSAGERVGHPVPDQPRPQLGELVGRVAAGQQVEGRVERRPGQRREGRSPAYDGEQLVGVPGVDRDAGDDLLGEHVERVGRHLERLDLAGPHPLDRDRGLDQVGPVLGEQHAARHLADLVTGAADPLQAAGDRRRRLDLDRPGRPRPCRCRARGSRSRPHRAAARP